MRDKTGDMRPSNERTTQLANLAVAIAKLDADLLDSFLRLIDTKAARKGLLIAIDGIISNECLELERRISSGSLVTRSEKP